MTVRVELELEELATLVTFVSAGLPLLAAMLRAAEVAGNDKDAEHKRRGYPALYTAWLKLSNAWLDSYAPQEAKHDV